MRTYLKGDVVLVRFPISKRTRPGVVVNVDEHKENELVGVIPLCSFKSAEQLNVKTINVRMDSPAGLQGGLRADCSVDCALLALVPNAFLDRKIGSFPESLVNEIERLLRFQGE